jgi:hypothetical protein
MALEPLVLDSARLRPAVLAGGVALVAMAAGAPGLPCLLRQATGIPCPLCGMTTSVRALAAGDLGASLQAHPFGVVLVAVALAALVRRFSVSVPLPPALAVLAACWLYQLVRLDVLTTVL